LWDEQFSISDDHDVLLGCAHYGCVYRTNQPGIVFKITTDVSEAHFIKIALDLKPQVDPIGIVEYFKVFALPPETTHLNRPVFAVWREEAFNVGDAEGGWKTYLLQKHNITDDAAQYAVQYMPWEKLLGKENMGEVYYFQKSFDQLKRRMRQYMMHADEVRNRLVKLHKKLTPDEYWSYVAQQWNSAVVSRNFYDELFSDDDGEMKTIDEVARTARDWEKRLQMHLAICDQQAELMRNEYMGDGVGAVLQDYLDAGILLADVHMGNIGTRRDDLMPIIVDPGHAVFFKREFETVGVPMI
jgi:hypothetical protein